MFAASSPLAAMATAMAAEAADGTIRVGNLRVEVREGELGNASRLAGRRVRVAGEWNAETGSLEHARIEPAVSIAAGVRHVSIQGYVSEGSGASESVRIEDVRVQLRANGFSAEQLPIDTRVRVEGEVDDSGHVRANRILIEERRPPGRDERSSSEAVGDQRSRVERSDRSDRFGRSERADRPERPERSGRSERSTQ